MSKLVFITNYIMNLIYRNKKVGKFSINFVLARSLENKISNLSYLKTRILVTRVLITTKARSRFMHREFQS